MSDIYKVVQKYWDDRPCNIRHSAAPVGTLQYFEEVRARKYYVEPHIPKFACFPKWEGKTVLEIGCGIGTDAIEFALHGAYVVAVDLSSRSLALTRMRALEYGVEDRVLCIQGDIEKDSLPKMRYSLVYSFGALHHTPNPYRAYSRIADHMSGDTALKVMLYNRLSWKALMLTHGRLWDNFAIAQQSEAQSGCPVTYAYTSWAARRILEQWFIVDRLRIDHIFPYKVEEYKNYEYVKEWWARLPGFHSAEKVLGWHLLIDARKW